MGGGFKPECGCEPYRRCRCGYNTKPCENCKLPTCSKSIYLKFPCEKLLCRHCGKNHQDQFRSIISREIEICDLCRTFSGPAKFPKFWEIQQELEIIKLLLQDWMIPALTNIIKLYF